MKLKEAIKLARKLKLNWVAVDYSGAICAYSSKPERLNTLWDTTEEFKYIGGYTGGKDWIYTLRKVHLEAFNKPYDPKAILDATGDEDITFNDAWEFGLNRLDDMKTEFKELAKDEGNGGSTPNQYGIPEGSKDLQDLIEYRNIGWNLGNIFKAIYRIGFKNTRMYELRKMEYFIDREIKLETSSLKGTSCPVEESKQLERE